MTDQSSSRSVKSSLKRTWFSGHLGIVAGVFRELEVEKLIDEKLLKERDHIVPHSVCILAMVLNLGFIDQPLYIFPYFSKTFLRKGSLETV